MTNDIQTARKNFAAARTIERNWRLKRYSGRNSNATTETHAWKLRLAHEAVSRCDRKAQGLLTAEHKLAQRIAMCKDTISWDRPELVARLRATRAELRQLDA